MRHHTRTHTSGNELLSPSPLSRSGPCLCARCHPSSLYRRHLICHRRGVLFSNRQFRMLHRGVCTVETSHASNNSRVRDSTPLSFDDDDPSSARRILRGDSRAWTVWQFAIFDDAPLWLWSDDDERTRCSSGLMSLPLIVNPRTRVLEARNDSEYAKYPFSLSSTLYYGLLRRSWPRARRTSTCRRISNLFFSFVILSLVIESAIW